MRHSPLARALFTPALLRHDYQKRTGRALRLYQPADYTEGIQWHKAFGQLENYAPLTDKFTARAWVAQRLGPEFLIPLLGIYDRAADLPWDALPDRFLLKASHGSGWNLFVDRATAPPDRAAITKTLTRWLSLHYYDLYLEPSYLGIRPRLLVEPHLGAPGQDVTDYKLYCFAGEPQIIHRDLDPQRNHQTAYYDTKGRRLPITASRPAPETEPPRIPDLAGLLAAARVLAAPFPSVRVDFIRARDRWFFGELTFSDGSGHERFAPDEVEARLGQLTPLCAAPSAPYWLPQHLV
jgi:hypothetical protein